MANDTKALPTEPDAAFDNKVARLVAAKKQIAAGGAIDLRSTLIDLIDVVGGTGPMTEDRESDPSSLDEP